MKLIKIIKENFLIWIFIFLNQLWSRDCVIANKLELDNTTLNDAEKQIRYDEDRKVKNNKQTISNAVELSEIQKSATANVNLIYFIKNLEEIIQLLAHMKSVLQYAGKDNCKYVLF